MTDHARPFRHLSEAEALRALYIDFEGEKGEPPILLGVHRRGRGARPFVQQDVLDEAFAGLAGSCLSLHDAVEKVVRRAEHGDRRIVAWTEHELEVVQTLAAEDPELVARFEARFVNARAVAERWRNKLHDGDRPKPGRLVDYLVLVGYPVPGEAAGGDVGETIRVLGPAGARALPYLRAAGALGSPSRAQPARLRGHAARICLRATAELSDADDDLRHPVNTGRGCGHRRHHRRAYDGPAARRRPEGTDGGA